MHLATSIIRDFFKKDISRVVVDSKKMYNDIVSYLKIADKRSISKIEYYNGITPVFVALGIEKEISRTNKRHLTLPNGANIIIDKAEALTVIDVNSGRANETDQEQNILQTNIEAGLEISKQIRLRDIGGIIIVDFIDMYNDEHKRILYNEMINMMRHDKARIAVYPLTQLGIMQISRQRIHQNLIEKISDVCPTCNGKGRIISNSTLLNSIEK
jgi:ribonuclease G